MRSREEAPRLPYIRCTASSLAYVMPGVINATPRGIGSVSVTLHNFNIVDQQSPADIDIWVPCRCFTEKMDTSGTRLSGWEVGAQRYRESIPKCSVKVGTKHQVASSLICAQWEVRRGNFPIYY